MSGSGPATPDHGNDVDDTDPWEQLAEKRETLEMVVEEDVPFSDRAEELLDRLEEEGY